MKQERNLPAVLVPDATNRAALTTIRSLGSRGCPVTAGAPARASLGVASRYAREFFLHPPPAIDPAGFTEAIAGKLRQTGIGVVMPAADVPASALLQHRELLPAGTRLVLPPEAALERAHDKIGLMDLAASIGVPVPRGFTARGDFRSDPKAGELSYPLVLKPRVSRYYTEQGWRNASVRIAADAEQVEDYLKNCPEYEALDYLVQEKVPGEGRGVFLLARNGELQAVFAHRRIREKPPSGGVSTLCESAEPEPELLEYSRKLMSALNWSGVAMVEFKWDPETRRAWLMEINGRFWGSMQLAVASGVDFPWLLYCQEVLGEAGPADTGASRRRLLWILGDLDHFLLRLRRGDKPGALFRDLIGTRQGTSIDFDTFRMTDPYPFVLELFLMVRDTARSIVARLRR
ncbi:MAG: ATP-grasp domain-containing protein [Acidobacteria bacterium]|uniref:ATP-grasp domain-containing protein n=1 Tax=Candidatus Polarisedimenticola svalbardensis TaxID=2886004 RepID=A0A8J6XY09_9BACT|nr:ATP-grasp domain-containing protein [Candidatus Polarisedimenticola svalbardensis]